MISRVTGGDPAHGAFVKLCTRSPKDAVLASEELRHEIADGLATAAAATATQDQWDRLVVRSFIRGASRALRVSSGAAALRFFLGSRRIHEDVTAMELRHGGTPHWSLVIAVRLWDPRVEPEYEFRMVVHEGVVTAATQYSRILYVPELAAKKAEIARALLEHHGRVKHLIPVPSYVMDVALSPELNWATIVELNHPPPVAGTALFDWQNEADREILLRGPFTLRVNERLPPGAVDEMCGLHPPLREFIQGLKRGQKATAASTACNLQ